MAARARMDAKSIGPPLAAPSSSPSLEVEPPSRSSPPSLLLLLAMPGRRAGAKPGIAANISSAIGGRRQVHAALASGTLAADSWRAHMACSVVASVDAQKARSLHARSACQNIAIAGRQHRRPLRRSRSSRRRCCSRCLAGPGLGRSLASPRTSHWPYIGDHPRTAERRPAAAADISRGLQVAKCIFLLFGPIFSKIRFCGLAPYGETLLAKQNLSPRHLPRPGCLGRSGGL